MKGSSSQILIPLVEKCLPILIPLRKDDMKAVQMAQAELAKQMEPEQGTVVTVDKVGWIFVTTIDVL